MDVGLLARSERDEGAVVGGKGVGKGRMRWMDREARKMVDVL